MGTRIDRAASNIELHEPALAFGLKWVSVDGLDVADVQAAVQGLMDAVGGGTPGFLAVKCYWYFGRAR